MKNIFASVFLIVSIFLNSELYAQTDTLKQSKLEHWYGFNLGTRYNTGLSYVFKYNRFSLKINCLPDIWFSNYSGIDVWRQISYASLNPQFIFLSKPKVNLLFSQSFNTTISTSYRARTNLSFNYRSGFGTNFSFLKVMTIQSVIGCDIGQGKLYPCFDFGLYYRIKKSSK